MANPRNTRKNLRKDRSLNRVRKECIIASNSGPSSPALQAIMEHLAQALALVIVCHRSLEAQSSADVWDEQETLRRAIRLLKDVYDEIDRASTEIEKAD